MSTTPNRGGLERLVGGNRRDRIIRSAVLALVTYALGLIPFYFLTPVHQAVPALLSRDTRPVETPVPSAVPTTLGMIPATSTRTKGEIQKRVGADVAPVSGPDNVSVVPGATPTAPTSDSRYAFLLLGYGGPGHDGAYLTDSMQVVVVDPGHRTLTLLSLPRDSWVPLVFDGRHAVYNKVNTAFAFAKDSSLYPNRLAKYTGPDGAGVFTTDTVSKLLGVPIRYYMGIDFQGFRQMINTVGGVDVVVPDSFSARYPVNDNPDIDASWTTVSFHQGPEHMNGERAIEFSRAREVLDNVNEGSDFARSRRQRLIIEAFKARMMQPGGLIHLPQLLGIANSHIDTNYSIPDVAQLSQLVLDWKDVKIYQAALTTANYLEEGTGPEGTYLLVPSEPDHSWAQIQAFTQRLWKDPPVGVAMASTSVLVENDSGVPGAGARLSAQLMRLGYQVKDPVAGATRTDSRLIDRTAGGASPLDQQLEADLGKTLGVVVDPPVAGADNQIVLQLGVNDADQALATQVPELRAPYSTAGVTNFGSWVPYTPPTEVPPTATPVRRRIIPTVDRRPAAVQTLAADLTGTPVPETSGTSTAEPATPLSGAFGSVNPLGESPTGVATPLTPLGTSPTSLGTSPTSLAEGRTETPTPAATSAPSPTLPRAPTGAATPTRVATPIRTATPRPSPSPTVKR